MALHERLQILVTADAKGAASEFQRLGATADRELGKSDKRLTNMSSSLTKFGVNAGLAGGVATAGVFALATAAGNYEEAASRAGVIFGSSAEEIESFGKSALNSAGLSRRAAVEAANTFGVFGKSLGLTGSELTGFSTDLTQLAGDMASFANTSTDEAIQAIGSALRGEMDPIEKYGIILNEQALKQEAMALGLETSSAALTSQQKILAVNSLLFKQSSDAQGDYVRTSDSLSNQTKTLSAELDNLKVAVGEGAVPVFSDLIGAVNGGLGAFQEMSPETQNLVGKLGAIGAIGVTAAGGMAFAAGGAIKGITAFREFSARAQSATGATGALGRTAVSAGKAMGTAGLVAGVALAVDALYGLTQSATAVEATLNRLQIVPDDATLDESMAALNAYAEERLSLFDRLLQPVDGGDDIFNIDGEVISNLTRVDTVLENLLKNRDTTTLRTMLDTLREAADLESNSGNRDELLGMVREYERALGDQKKAQDKNAGSAGKLDTKLDGLSGTSEDAATASEAFGAAMEKAGAKAKRSTVGIDAAAAAGKAFSESMENATSADDLLSSGLGVASALRSLKDGFTGGADAAEEAADETDTLADALDNLDDSLKRADPAFSELGISMGAAEAAAEGFSKSIEDSTSLDDQLGAAVNLGEAFDNFEKSAKRLPPTIDLMGIALGNLKPRQRDAVNDLLSLADASKDYLSTLIESGASSGQVAAEAGQLRDALRDQLVQLGLNEQQINEFVKTAGLLPEQITTAIKVSGVDAAMFEVDTYLQLLDGRIPESVATSVAAKINAGDIEGAANQLAGLAATNPSVIVEVDSSEVDKAKEKLFSLPQVFDPLTAAMGGYTEEQENALAAVQNLGEGVQEYLGSLVESGQTDKAVTEAARLREEYRKQFEQYGITGAAFDTYADKLLNLDGKVIQVAVELADETELLTEIQLLTDLMGAELEGNPNLQALITAQVAQGDLEGARGVLAAFQADMEDGFINDPLLIAAGVSTDAASEGLRDWRDYVSKTPPVDAKVAADTTEADDDVMFWQWVTNQAEATVQVDANTDRAFAKLGDFFRAAANPMFMILDTVAKIPGGRPAAGLDRNPNGGIDGLPWTPYAFGGRIAGAGGDMSDDVPILASNNEFMVKANSAKSVGYDVLGYMNATGSLPQQGGDSSARLDSLAVSLESLAQAVRESNGGLTVNVEKVVAPSPERVPEALLTEGRSAAWMAGV